MDPQEWNPEEFTWQQIDSFYTRLTFTPAFYSLINGESSLGLVSFIKSSDDFEKNLNNAEENPNDSNSSSEESKEGEYLVDFIAVSI